MKRIHVCSAIKNRAFVNSQALTMAVCIRTDDSRARRRRDRRPVWLVDVERESSTLCTSRRAEPSTSLRPSLSNACRLWKQQIARSNGSIAGTCLISAFIHATVGSSILACASILVDPSIPHTRVAATGELVRVAIAIAAVIRPVPHAKSTTGVPLTLTRLV